jgi:hypothetical protein
VTERPKKCRCPASEGGSVWRIVSRQHACSPSWLRGELVVENTEGYLQLLGLRSDRTSRLRSAA